MIRGTARRSDRTFSFSFTVAAAAISNSLISACSFSVADDVFDDGSINFFNCSRLVRSWASFSA